MPINFLNAEQICGYVSKNLEIQFQLEGDDMQKTEAVEHFRKRNALMIVRNLLIDESERVFKEDDLDK